MLLADAKCFIEEYFVSLWKSATALPVAIRKTHSMKWSKANCTEPSAVDSYSLPVAVSCDYTETPPYLHLGYCILDNFSGMSGLRHLTAVLQVQSQWTVIIYSCNHLHLSTFFSPQQCIEAKSI